MSGSVTWVALVGLAVSISSLGLTIAIFLLGRRLSFRQQRERVRELEEKAWEVLGPIRTRGLSSKIILMNVARYKRGYNGSNDFTWHGYAYEGHELIEIRHGGIEVITGGGYDTWWDADGRRTSRETSEPAGLALEIGHVPWTWIEDIKPDGDEFDGSAIFFVTFRGSGRSPFDYNTYVEGETVPMGPADRPWHRPIGALGTYRPPKVRAWLRFLRRWWLNARWRRRTGWSPRS